MIVLGWHVWWTIDLSPMWMEGLESDRGWWWWCVLGKKGWRAISPWVRPSEGCTTWPRPSRQAAGWRWRLPLGAAKLSREQTFKCKSKHICLNVWLNLPLKWISVILNFLSFCPSPCGQAKLDISSFNVWNKTSDLQVDSEAQNHEVSFETQRVEFLRHTEEAL